MGVDVARNNLYLLIAIFVNYINKKANIDQLTHFEGIFLLFVTFIVTQTLIILSRFKKPVHHRKTSLN